MAVEAAQSSQAKASKQKARADEFEKGLDESIKNFETLVQAVEQKEAECDAMSEAISAFCRTFRFEDIPSGSSPWSRMRALSGQVRSELHGALHIGVKRALAVVSSHYEVDLERVSDGYVLPEDEDAAEAEVQRLEDIAEGPGATLASYFNEEVVPSVSPPGAGSHFEATPASEAASAAAGGADSEDVAALRPDA